MIEVITQEEINALLEKGPVVIDFWAAWCGPCRAIAPIFEQVGQKNTNVTFVKCNIDNAPAVASAYGISAIPTLKFLKNDVTFDTVMGMISEKALQEKVDNLL